VIIKLIPVLLTAILFSAHLLRFAGWAPAIISFLFIGTLFIRNKWIPRIWQVYLGIAFLTWIKITIGFVQYRIAMHIPWVRLIIIMGLIILLTAYSIFRFENKTVSGFYRKK